MHEQPEPSGERIPDPAALAQGHRLSRVARGLTVPAWVFGLFALALLGVGFLDEAALDVGLGLAVALAIGWVLLARPRSYASASSQRADSRLPGEVHEVLALIDGLVDQLERGHDRGFGRDVIDLGIALNGLRPNACRYLEERGADPTALHHGTCSSAELATGLSIERRRALHRDLVRFVAAARGRPCGDPYRSRIGGSSLLGALFDPALARTRRLYGVTVTLIASAWLGAWIGLATWRHGVPLEICNPFALETSCRFAFQRNDLAYAGVVVVALVPVFLLVAAAAARAAAWRSWASALPEQPLEESGGESPGFVAQRRRLVRRRFVGRASWMLALALAAGWVLARLDLSWRRFELGDVVLGAGLLALSLVLVPALTAALERRGELWAFERRLGSGPQRRELLTELFAARIEQADAEPPRAELFEQLANALAEAKQLDALELGDRDRVVARLRAATSRGATCSRAQRDRLLLDVRTCEALIGEQKRR